MNKFELYNEDCIKGINNLKDNSIDLVISDPPFGIDFKNKSNYNRDSDSVLSGYVDIDSNNYKSFTDSWIESVKSKLKNNGSMYIFSGWNNLEFILSSLRENNFIIINHIIWKYNFGVYCKKKFITSHYHILYVCKTGSERTFNTYCRFSKNNNSDVYKDMEDVWIIKREYWRGETKTPTKLPLELVDKIIQYSSNKKDTVLDPFMGSGQVGISCLRNKRKYIGFEIVPSYFGFSKNRIIKESLKLKLRK